MRVAETAEEFEQNFLLAQTEARQAFGDDSMYIEHFITHPRHIEFQILADSFGHVIHLGERDCSIQRNHQKMIEEAPSIALSEELRREMGETAVRAAKAARLCERRNHRIFAGKEWKILFHGNEYPDSGGASGNGVDYRH